jgi:glycosyltransferase involved in cell wall biosynthesis
MIATSERTRPQEGVHSPGRLATPARQASVRLAIVASHPVQYYAPVFRALAARCDLHVFYGQQLSPQQHAATGFKTAFEWDVDLMSGYKSTLLRNVSRRPASDRFMGCDTPEIAQHLRAGGFSAVLVTGWHLKTYVQAIIAAKRAGIPAMVRGDSHLETRRSALKRHLKEIVNPAFLRLFDRALYVGAKSRAFYEHYHYPSERLFFSPHCIDTDWFARRATPEARAGIRAARGIGDGTFAVLFAGKIEPCKRPLDIIAAAARCRGAGRRVEVMVAGSGELEEAMRRCAQEAAVPLHMLGFCNQTGMPAAYAAADALILPSESETWGLVANEALACGRPVILSNACGAAPDLAADGKAGRVTPLGDVKAIAAAITSLIEQPPDAAAIRARSDSYSIARAVEGILEAAEGVHGNVTSNRNASHAA